MQQQNRNYSGLTPSEISTLQDLRDRVYEDHGCITHNPNHRILINLCYHMMWEITVALKEEGGSWGEEEAFLQTHEELVKLLNYQRPVYSED